MTGHNKYHIHTCNLLDMDTCVFLSAVGARTEPDAPPFPSWPVLNPRSS